MKGNNITYRLGSHCSLQVRVQYPSQHEYSISVALYNGKKEGSVHGDSQRNSLVLRLVRNLRPFFGHLKKHFVDHLSDIM